VLAQSVPDEQGHAPSVPEPHATHLLSVHVFPTPQSLATLQSTGGPAALPGGTHSPPVQTSPFGQSLEATHIFVQLPPTHSNPLMQSLLVEHDVEAGGETVEHP